MTDTDKIRQLNDAFRSTFIGGQVMLTSGIRSKSEKEITEILEHVRTFNNFTQENDPYQEHDFGSVICNDDKMFWKIDYYDKSLKYGSDNPADPTITTRVLTIMTANEY